MMVLGTQVALAESIGLSVSVAELNRAVIDWVLPADNGILGGGWTLKPALGPSSPTRPVLPLQDQSLSGGSLAVSGPSSAIGLKGQLPTLANSHIVPNADS